jgi:hypothetical protein
VYEENNCAKNNKCIIFLDFGGIKMTLVAYKASSLTG